MKPGRIRIGLAERLLTTRLAVGEILLGAVIVAGFFVTIVRAQPQTAVADTFDAASIRLHVFSEGRGGTDATRVTRDSGRVRLQAMTVLAMIQFAYDVTANRVKGLPQWAFEEVYDCVATGSSPATLDQQKLMLQGLLADRFGLNARREAKEGQIYTLTLIPGRRPRLTQSTEDNTDDIGHFRSLPVIEEGGATFHIDYTGTNVAMEDLATWLSRNLASPVLEQTGIEGRFDIEIHGPSIEMTPGSSEDRNSFMSIVRDQLGLQLKSQRGMVDTLMIEGIQKPSEN